MATKQFQQQREPEEVAKEAEQIGMSPAVLAAAGSVMLSWYHFFLRGNREMGLFVGLWPPTILAFASYFNQREMREQIQTVAQPGNTIMEAIEGVMGGGNR